MPRLRTLEFPRWEYGAGKLLPDQGFAHFFVESARQGCFFRCGVKGAKGNKDRVVPLPGSMIEMLRSYYRIYKPALWLFEGQKRGEQYSETSLREIFIHALEIKVTKFIITSSIINDDYTIYVYQSPQYNGNPYNELIIGLDGELHFNEIASILSEKSAKVVVT